MLQKVKLVSVFIVLILVLSGCQEVDRTGPITQEKTIKVEKSFELSEVSAPSEVYIYSAEYWDWEAETKTVLNVFLDGVYEEKNNLAEGEQYIFKPDSKEQKVVNIFDGGRSFYGERKLLGTEAGFAYDYSDIRFGELFPEYYQLDKEYYVSGKIYSQDLDEGEEAFVAAKEEVEDYLEKLHMEHYTVHAAAELQGEKPKNKGVVIYWRQAIDEIPISGVIILSSGQNAGTMVYNSQLDFDEEMFQPSSKLVTEFFNGELTWWNNSSVIRVKDKLKKCPVISASEAYEKVEERYQKYTAGVSAPTLEMAELQYKMLELGGTVYLYPIWTFCVKTEGEYLMGGKKITESTWNYYLIDAVSGEFFTGIDVGELEG